MGERGGIYLIAYQSSRVIYIAEIWFVFKYLKERERELIKDGGRKSYDFV